MRKLGLALVALGVAAGCSAPAAAPPASVPITPALSSSAGPANQVVPATLKFTGKTLDGASFDAATLAGKPAILWFWAPWCATCASEAQSISDLADEYKDRIGILGIAGMGENKAMHEFVSDLEVGHVTHLDDQAGTIWKRFRITQQSWYVFLDKQGRVVKTGYLDDLQLTDEVKTLVA
ncbi:protein disulfide oxidoreductase [Paractinoplanes ferrugineus]|uniref:Thiol:disulfide interchange protein n=1 Tax=Paractinoplanes ferrugineus TaxID=113564 RepID=A0A919IZR4_9ACTN|nr:redoxin domain-containing protein [Actinoplanes ferrugineus]GIE11084.1 thiol:disulfide interchange protein [Actinoplanes ferrugineus]